MNNDFANYHYWRKHVSKTFALQCAFKTALFVYIYYYQLFGWLHYTRNIAMRSYTCTDCSPAHCSKTHFYDLIIITSLYTIYDHYIPTVEWSKKCLAFTTFAPRQRKPSSLLGDLSRTLIKITLVQLNIDLSLTAGKVDRLSTHTIRLVSNQYNTLYFTLHNTLYNAGNQWFPALHSVSHSVKYRSFSALKTSL